MSGALVTAGVLPVTTETSPTATAPVAAAWTSAMDQASQASQASQATPAPPPSPAPTPAPAPASTPAAAGQKSAPRPATKKSDVSAGVPEEDTAPASPQTSEVMKRQAEQEPPGTADAPHHKHAAATTTPVVADPAASTAPVAAPAARKPTPEQHADKPAAKHEAKTDTTSQAMAASVEPVAAPTAPTAKPVTYAARDRRSGSGGACRGQSAGRRHGTGQGSERRRDPGAAGRRIGRRNASRGIGGRCNAEPYNCRHDCRDG